MITLALALQGLVLPPAQAQTFDSQGPALPPAGADVRDPAYGLGGAETGAPVITVLGHSANDVLVGRLAEGPDNTERERIVGAMFGADVSGQMGIYGPIGIGLSVPTWFFSLGTEGGGPTLGDATVWLPVNLFSLEAGHALGLAPFVNLPTGAQKRYLGEGGVTGGALLTARIGAGKFFAQADAGFDVTPLNQVSPAQAAARPWMTVLEDQWPGGTHYRFALDGGYSPTDKWAIHAEYRGRGPLVSKAASLPSELMATLKVVPRDRYWFTASAGSGFSRGPGASTFRGLIGITIAPGSKPVDAQIVQPPPPREVHVVDARAFPIRGATVTAGGSEAVTDAEGYAYLPPRAFRDGVLEITHPHYESSTVSVDPGDPFFSAELSRSPVPVAVSVVGPAGSLMMVEVEVDGPYDAGPAQVDEAGVHRWDLEPGAWFVRMSSPGLGTQERTIVIEKQRVEPIRVDAVLASGVEGAKNRVRVEVVDRFGRPVEDAVVALQDRDLGTTGTGGDVIVLGVEQGAGTLTIRSDKFGDKAKFDVVIDEEGDQVVQAVVDWRPGSVQVQAIDPSGEPVDATVNFIGPANLPPRGTGSDGSELFVLRPGRWEVEISAAGLGTQTRVIDVTEQSGEVVVVDVGLQAAEGGPADVRLVVRDPNGDIIEGAEVALDGKMLGKTGPNGDIELKGLNVGERTFTVTGPMIDGGELKVELMAGQQNATATVPWKDGVLDVAATDVNGEPVAANLIIKGPNGKQEVLLGSGGEDRLELGPGEYTVIAQAEGFAKQERKVILREGGGGLSELSFKLAPHGEVADVSVVVKGPDGRLIDDASVSFDGQTVGDVVDGALVTTGIAAGPLLIGVEREGMQSASVGTAVMLKEDNQVEVGLEWAPGATQMEILGPDGNPIEATVTVRTSDGSMGMAPRVVSPDDPIIGLQPGEWQLVIEAEGMKTAVVDLGLADVPMLTTLPVLMEARPLGTTVVVVKAETDRGAAVADAEVEVNGQVVGRTTSAGTFELSELPEQGTVDVTVTPTDGIHDAIEIPIDMTEVNSRGQTEIQAAVVVQESAQEIAVMVEDGSGEQVPAKVLAVQGADTKDAVDLGSKREDGLLSLRPGVYTITAQTEDGKVATTDIVVPERDARTGGLPDQRAYIMGADDQGMSPDGQSTVLVAENGMAMLSLRVESIDAAMSEGVVVPVNPILFDTGKFVLRYDGTPLVRDLARWLTAHREAALVEIGGHTDSVGGVVYNQQLSENRAITVMNALIDFGVSPERLRARGYGLSRPVTTNSDEAGRQRNRRVELTVLDWVEE